MHKPIIKCSTRSCRKNVRVNFTTKDLTQEHTINQHVMLSEIDLAYSTESHHNKQICYHLDKMTLTTLSLAMESYRLQMESYWVEFIFLFQCLQFRNPTVETVTLSLNKMIIIKQDRKSSDLI